MGRDDVIRAARVLRNKASSPAARSAAATSLTQRSPMLVTEVELRQRIAELEAALRTIVEAWDAALNGHPLHPVHERYPGSYGASYASLAREVLASGTP